MSLSTRTLYPLLLVLVQSWKTRPGLERSRGNLCLNLVNWFTSIIQEKEQHLDNWDLGMAFEPWPDFQRCGILTSVDSDEHVQPTFKLRNSKWCSVSSLTIIEYSSD